MERIKGLYFRAGVPLRFRFRPYRFVAPLHHVNRVDAGKNADQRYYAGMDRIQSFYGTKI